jgi:uncharacterized surface protein with fasciclin (FAS1) repeats
MKILKNLKTVFVLAFVATATLSCDDEVNTTPVADTTITGLAKGTANLSILVQALTRADLANNLSGKGPFTVFAPTNAAFTAFLQANNFANLNAVPVPVLKEILLNHVVSGSLQSTALTTGYVKTLGKGSASATNTLSMYVNTANNGVRLNGVSSVTTPNIAASNGVIHIVDAVIGLPTIVTHATANSNFTTLVSLLNRPGQPNFVATLGTPGPFTVFAPTNAAFTALNTELAPGGTASVSADNITKVLQSHVVGANVLAASLTNNQVVNTILPGTPSTTFQTFTVNLTPARITDAANRVTNIVATDVQCANGVIHVLERVLLPAF